MRPIKEQIMMQMAEIASKRSTCERMSVGCVVTNNAMTRIFGFGYNGNYAGGKNGCDRSEPGHCGKQADKEISCL
jgi:deoxycytidylate deaminase